jgi:hypothetical protein
LFYSNIYETAEQPRRPAGPPTGLDDEEQDDDLEEALTLLPMDEDVLVIPF